jgi:hypothetical protein
VTGLEEAALWGTLPSQGVCMAACLNIFHCFR